MKRSVIETVLGAVVLFLAGFFLVFSYRTADIKKVSGYEITASFSGIGGLGIGDDVRISGVKVGSVADVSLDQKNYLAVVTMSIEPSIKLPDDTAAVIASESLLGGRYMELQPGASETMLEKGGQIQYTQSPQNLEQLLGKFIFSMQSEKKDGNKQEGASGESSLAAPEAAVPAAPVEEQKPAAPQAVEAPETAPAVENAPADAVAAPETAPSAEQPAAPAEEAHP